MPATPIYALRYPAATDPADVPADLQKLATDVETKIAPGTVAGQIPIWDQTNKKWVPGIPLGAELGYAQLITNVAVDATPKQMIALPPITLDGATSIMLELFIPLIETPTNSPVVCDLREAGSSIGLMAQISPGGAWKIQVPTTAKRKLATPSSGAHTYSVWSYTGGGSGQWAMGSGAGGFVPCYFRAVRA